MRTKALGLFVVAAAMCVACVGGGEGEPGLDEDVLAAADVGSHESELLSTCSFRNQFGRYGATEADACESALWGAHDQCVSQSGVPCCQLSGKVTLRVRDGRTWCEYRRYMFTDW